MKLILRTASFLLLGIVLAGSASAAAGPLQYAALVSGSIGQLNLFNRQPKEDPFKPASQSVKKLMEEKKQQASQHLRQGREALAAGNLNAASFHHDRAVALEVRFTAQEDSPARLAADIERLKNISSTGLTDPRIRPLPTAENPIRGNPTRGTETQNLGPRYAVAAANPPESTETAGGLPNGIDPQVVARSNTPKGSPVTQAVYNPRDDQTFNRPVASEDAADDDIFLSPPTNTVEPAPASPDPLRSASRPIAVNPLEPAKPLEPTTKKPFAELQLPTNPAVPIKPTPPLRPTAPLKVEPPVKLSPGVVILEKKKRGDKKQQVEKTNPAPTAETDQVAEESVAADLLQTPEAGDDDDQLILETGQAEERLKQQVLAEVARQSRQALDMRAEDPVGAIGELQKTRAMIAESSLSKSDKKILFGRMDRMLVELENYVDRHRAEIELNEHNQQILDDLKRKRDYRVEVDQRLALLVDQYNTLRNEQRFYEAEVKAKEARTLAPDEPVVTQMFEEIRFYRRVMNNQDLREQKEDAVWNTLNSVEFASVPYGDDRNPIQFIDHGDWKTLSERRSQFSGDADRERHPAEIEIERKLGTPVSLKFKDAPLSEVMAFMKKVADINIYLDPLGLAEEGVHPSTPVTIDLSQEISLRSAMNLILGPLHLDYIIKNEVLKVTSEQLRDRNVYSKTYNVADLVLPIPNAPVHSQLGLPDSLARGYERTNQNLAGATGFQPPQINVASHTGVPGLADSAATPENTLAQSSGNFSSGGQAGGNSQADFDSLMELITTTIEPESWEEVGGEGAIAPFDTNLSLVISQTQEVHDKIADLLAQLRRLQDLQVTIEVRFINLKDDFFEQIGIDFDLNIDSNVTDVNLPNNDNGRSTTIGLGFDTGGNPTEQRAARSNPINNLINGENDIQIRQGSFPVVAPGFGGYAANTATTMGIAILSDLEAYFFVRAVQGDKRTNILQSPKVTLFNGQAASVSDQIQQPFVTSVTPVVGDFAAAQAPVIVVLAEGTTLSVQAVVSPDRRYVRLTLVPFFSEIREVNEFTFEGSTTSTDDRTDSNEETAAGGSASASTNNSSNFTQGTTIQLPTFAFTTVTTTVSVPDGGTVLLGGIKRLNEQRDEIGTPFLSKLPYVSRLFKNVAIGRETESLMLMVTPRIIIQEEEEANLGLALP